MNEEFKATKYTTLCIATASVFFVGMVFIQILYYLQETAKLDLLHYDISTCTASDYTVEMDITEEML